MKTIPVWSITVFFVGFFCLPNLPACQPNPTNYWQFADGQIVPVNQVTNIVQPAQEMPTKPEPKVFAACIVAVIAIAVVGYIIYQIIKLCNKIPPVNPPPPPPPTNSPPYAVVNPVSGNSPAIPAMSSTNTWDYTDISALNYADQISKGKFYAFWSCGCEATTNFVDWEDTHHRIDAWVGQGTFYAYYRYGTNYYNCYFTQSTNTPASFDFIERTNRTREFFRLAPKSL